MPADINKPIFIVEDNQIFAMMLDYILSKESLYHFENFKSGEECLLHLKRNPQIIILDYNLPGMNGYEMLLEIKKYNPKIHVLILSGNKDMKLATKLLNAGADDYILKQNHDENKIIEKIEALLKKDEIEDAIRIKKRNRLFLKKALYPILIIILITIFVIYSNLKNQ